MKSLSKIKNVKITFTYVFSSDIIGLIKYKKEALNEIFKVFNLDCTPAVRQMGLEQSARV